jgi:nucleotide-binding universal stress UspA family protein
MTTKILCSIDDSVHAKPALELAADLSVRLGAELTVCTVNTLVGGLRGPAIHLHNTDEADAIVQKGVDTATRRGAKGVNSAVLSARDVAVAIVQYANQNGFDHIVTGTGDKGSLTRFALGSVATDVVNRAHCPVTVAR